MDAEERKFYSFESRIKATITVRRDYFLAVGEDLCTALLLDQLIYWLSLSASGKERARIKRDGRRWVAKSESAWKAECLISTKQARRAIRILLKLGFVNKEVWKFAGAPTTHLSLNLDILGPALDRVRHELTQCGTESEGESIYTKGTNGNSPKGQMEIAQRDKSCTETTPESTLREYSSSSTEHAADAVQDDQTEEEEIDELIEELTEQLPPEFTEFRADITHILKQHGLVDLSVLLYEQECITLCLDRYAQEIAASEGSLSWDPGLFRQQLTTMLDPVP